MLLATDDVDQQQAVGFAQTGFDGVGQTLLAAVFYDQSVNDQLDVVFAVLVQLRWLLEAMYLAIHPDPGEAGLQALPEQFAVLALAVDDQRSKQLEASAFGQLADMLYDFGRRLSADGTLALVAVLDTDSREQHP